MKTLLKVLLWIAIVALVVFLTLFISAKLSGFDSIEALLNYIFSKIRS